MEMSQDGNFVYTMKTDNQQTFVAKYGVSDGMPYGIDLVDLKTSAVPGGFRWTYGQGIEPTADGGLLVSLFSRFELYLIRWISRRAIQFLGPLLGRAF